MDLAHFVGRYRAGIGALGLVLLVLGAWGAATAYAAPLSQTHTRETMSWQETSAFEYSVPVTRNSTHWPIGTTLPMDQPAYFRTISDSIHVSHGWSPTLPPDARGVAAARLIVQVEALDRDGRSYWLIAHTLAENSTDDASQGLALAGIVDLDALVHEVAILNKEAPLGEGTLKWSVRASVVWAMDVAGSHEQGETVDVLPIAAADPRFSLPTADELEWGRPHAKTESVTTSTPAGWPGALRSLRSLAAVALGAALFGTAALVGARAHGFEQEHRRFREWVSVAGSIPESARDAASIVDVESLEDLVHVAADARTRVLLDARTREFFALLPGVTYRYARHATTPVSG